MCIQDGQRPPQVLLNLRQFHVEATVDDTNSDKLKKFEKKYRENFSLKSTLALTDVHHNFFP